MAELRAETPCAGLVPVRVAGLSLSEVAPGRMTSVAPYRGQERALSAALKSAHGMAWPAPGRMTGREGARAIWFGQRMALLVGPDPDPALAAHAALTDQSDGWAVLRLEGAGAREVLARLTPLDLRERVFEQGHTARSELAHMAASVTRMGGDAWQVMVFRSMTATLVHEVETAMRRVAARGIFP
ncbi:sarcosine oxidase subunit gamma [Roseovarius azorensis]|uniref:Sarcosine oxidase subunit gamma n=1 Tax=Roseovarius azorensis TaxID=1287727 RepID=A0A1H7LA09_9RHOB|nr:sarcosine oxidase subunit gamma family protein [Roseovarius azorensis]SEK95781.1 sarcosine oxidase subunit gamma [Roseovarius azorensis]